MQRAARSVRPAVIVLFAVLAAAPASAADPEGVGLAVRTLADVRDEKIASIDAAKAVLQNARGVGGEGAISGSLIVAPTNRLETEPNSNLVSAEPIQLGETIAGDAADGDDGLIVDFGSFDELAVDFFSVSAAGPIRATLTIVSDDPITDDLDLILANSGGTILDASLGLISTEFVETAAGGDFILAVSVAAIGASSAYVLAVETLGPLGSAAEFQSGDVLVKMKEGGAKAEAKAALLAKGEGLEIADSSPQGVWRMTVGVAAAAREKIAQEGKSRAFYDEERARRALTLDAVRRLSERPDVAYAEPNYIRRAALVPNDDFYDLQWHYPAINLPQAWDVTTGDEDVLVAVIDTGVLSGHPDLAGRLAGGYDFFSNAGADNDGQPGIDANPEDPGDDPDGGNDSFHGTHVAGTVGAATNNTGGVAGVTWAGGLMNIRVLGPGGGTDFDIAQGILYAARLANNSGTLPPKRADVINMSLGGQGMSATQQGAVTAARAAGVIVIAAAGNNNSSAFFSPAGLTGVVSTSALDLAGEKAGYSNFGTTVDVAAPGGDTGADLNGDGFPDGVLSTLGTDAGAFNFRFYQGTSMASPHMAGVAGLMKAANPNLTPNDFDLLLAGTHPGTSRRITVDLGFPGRDDIFGHGKIDAAQAVRAALEVAGEEVPQTSSLSVSTTSMDFGAFLDQLQFNVSNGGEGVLTISSITDNQPWLSVAPVNGAAPLTVTATVDRTGLADGQYSATISIVSNATAGDPTAAVTVSMRVGGPTGGNLGPVAVAAFPKIGDDFSNMGVGVLTTAEAGYAFTITGRPAGVYAIIAGTDRDGDGFICDTGEACGAFPDPVTVGGGLSITGVVFPVGNQISLQGAAFPNGGAATGIRPGPRRILKPNE